MQIEKRLLFKSDGYEGWDEGPTGQGARLLILQDQEKVLVVKVTIAAMQVPSSGVTFENAHRWLWQIGMAYIQGHPDKRAKELSIQANNVQNGQIIGGWETVEVN
ncbi:hypothetical protein D5E69_14260 [Rossellomorea marisflavi]|uniref:hypothetical protein n=1 Tax=Rossellomorea marisflavi TaxID=189381 RepID=UPI00131736F0|nr:hypothetical protein [Rossellomorea marisflavi]QHA36862.1 hypothetical protein D5E69_14260 [Rossellomorea marisflavi]